MPGPDLRNRHTDYSCPDLPVTTRQEGSSSFDRLPRETHGPSGSTAGALAIPDGLGEGGHPGSDGIVVF